MDGSHVSSINLAGSDLPLCEGLLLLWREEVSGSTIK